MIGSFWNLCRACPSMPVDKLHSEYRSTYRWHEYRGARAAQAAAPPAAAVPAAGVTAPAPLTNGLATDEPVVRRAPLPSQVNANGPRAPSIEPAMPRRKKYPGLAYKTNEIFDGPAAGLPSGGRDGGPYTLDRARSMERTKFLANNRDRRSKSEGPRNAQNGPRNWTDTVEEKATSPSIEPTRASTEYRNQYAWPRGGETGAGAGAGGYMDGAGGQPRKSASMGALKAAQQARRRPAEGAPPELEPLMNHTDDDDDRKKYIEDFLREGETNTNQRKTTFRSAIATIRRGVGGDQPREPAKPAKGYKSEYKKKFRPFSHYVYEASKGTFTKRRAPKAGAGAEAEGAGGAAPPAAPEPGNALQAAGLQSLGMKNADSWYREVLDLRKRAGEYKYRGWGTELAPDHLTELYNKQMELWYQVSRRSSLSALSLASTNHRVLGQDDKDMEIKSRTSPSKKLKSFKSFPYQSIHAKIQETKQQQETPAQRAQRRKLQGHSFDNTSVSEGKPGRASARTSPRKQLNLVIGARGASVEPAASEHSKPLYRSPKRRPRSADPKPLSNGPVEDRRRPSKPSGLALNTTNKYTPQSDGSVCPTNERKAYPTASPKRKCNRTKVGIIIDDDAIPLRSGSAFRDHRGTLLDDSPVVKSPPEPTRVKSPEQMNMRSPDPVNWTVPLDTGKTFTVTQNVKSDDLIKRPGSDFRGGWGGDDTHSASFSAPLEPTESASKAHQEVASVHRSPTANHSTKDVSPPKSVEISQKPSVTNFKHAKTPTSPPNLTPIDEMKVLDVTKPIVNGGASSGSDTHPSPVTEGRLPPPQITPDDPSFEMASLIKNVKSADSFKPTEATQKSHGVDTAVVSPNSQASIAAEVLEKARTRFDQFWGKKEGGNDSV